MKVFCVADEEDCIALASKSRLFLGEGLFETLRFDKRGVWASQQHWARLQQSALALKIPFELSFAAWQSYVSELALNSTLDCGGIKVILMGGRAHRGLDSIAIDATLMMQTFAYNDNQKPLRLMRAPWQRDVNNPVYQHKTLNYQEAILAKRYAHDHDMDDVVFADIEGFITESTVANVFYVKNNRLFTPSLTGAVLPGIARSLLIQLAAKLGIRIIEKKIGLQECLAADAMFLSNALSYIQPVAQLENRAISVEHPLLRRLMTAVEATAPFIQEHNNDKP